MWIYHGSYPIDNCFKFFLLVILVCYFSTSVVHRCDASDSGNIDENQPPVCKNEKDIRKKVTESEDEIGFSQSIVRTNDKSLYSTKSQYQDIEVHESKYFGKMLVLDEVLQFTERDADSYNEMMAHIPMMTHVAPKRVLVIGGGDGYVLSEVLKHDSLQSVDHVDLDREVIEVCKKIFHWAGAWDDKRVTLHIADGASFVKNGPSNSYDVIIQDSSDPWTTDENDNIIPLPSGVLYTKEHFENIYRMLTPNGVFTMQAETFNIPSDLDGIVAWRKQALEIGFHSAQYGTIITPTYPTGQIGLLLCEKGLENRPSSQQIQKRFDSIVDSGRTTTYYHPALQEAAFALPLWVEKRIYGELKRNILNSTVL